MKWIKLCGSIGAAIIFSMSATAQPTGVIAGRVERGGVPVERARVQVVAGDRRVAEAYTDRDGRFGISAVPSGKYMLIVEREPGRGIAILDIELPAASAQPVLLSLTLEAYSDPRARPTIRETVTISADAEQPIEHVSKTVDTISAQEMRDRADITLADSLRSVPGLRIQQLGGFGRTASIKSRGLRNQDTAVLLDGMRFRDPAAITGDATPFISDLTLTSVARVEVLRGPGSSLYGTNAIGGTIDLQTPVPASGWHGQIGGAAGGLGMTRFRGNISRGASDGRFGFGAALSRTDIGKGLDGDDEARNTNFQSRVELNPLGRTNISAKLLLSDAFVMLNSSPATFGPLQTAVQIEALPGVNFLPDINDPDNRQRSRIFAGQVSASHAFDERFAVQLSYQTLASRRRNTNGPLGVGFQPFSGADEDDIFRGRIHTFRSLANWTPGPHRTTAGYEFEAETFENEHLTVIPADNFSVIAKQSGHTVFAQQLLGFLEGRFQLSGAVRIQTFSLADPKFTPMANPTYQNLPLDDPPTAYTSDASASFYFRSTGTKIRAHAGNGYRVPSLYERFGSFYSGFFGYSTSGDPFLKPEVSAAFDAGLDQRFFGDAGRVSLTYFYTDIRRSIDFGFCVPQCLPSPDPLGRFSGYFNSRGRVARGIEASVELKPGSSANIAASYTFTNSDERNPLNLAVPRSPAIPTHAFTAVITKRFGGFWMNGDLLWTSSYIFPFFHFNDVTFESRYLMYRFQGNRRVDMTAGYAFRAAGGSVRIFGTVENALDKKYFENGFRTPGVTARAGISFGF